MDLKPHGDEATIHGPPRPFHTREGKKRGKTTADFFKAEQAALQPFQPGLFDHLSES